MKFTMSQLRKEIEGHSGPQQIDQSLINEQIQKTIQGLSKESILPRNKAIFNSMVKYLAETKLEVRHKGLLYFGNCGAGKSFALKVIAAFRDIRYYDCEDLQERFNQSDKGFWEIIEDKKDIIIDDLGTEEAKNDFGIKFELFEKAIYKRHKMFEDYKIKTIIATNLDGAGIEKRYDKRIYSRLRQMCECVNATGKDLRFEE
jgi:DNA replication protein DnaC